MTTRGASGPSGPRPARPMRRGSACRAPPHAGIAARTCRGSHSGPNASSRSPTTTCRATGSGTRRRSSAGARTSRPKRAATTSSRRACPTSSRRSSAIADAGCPPATAVPCGCGSVGLSAHWSGGNRSLQSASGTSLLGTEAQRVRHASETLATDAAHPRVRGLCRARRHHRGGAGPDGRHALLGGHPHQRGQQRCRDHARVRERLCPTLRPRDRPGHPGSGRGSDHPNQARVPACDPRPTRRDPARRAAPTRWHDRRRERPHRSAGR